MALSSFGELKIGLLGIAVIGYVVFHFLRRKRHHYPLPPGPKGLPIVGNINDLPKPGERECDHWIKYKDLYGPISSITVLGQTFIIINDADMALKLLRDRSTIHANRPHLTFSAEMVGWKEGISFQDYNEDLRLQRKNIAKVVGSNNSLTKWDRIQQEEAAHFLVNLMTSPENLFEHIKKEAGTIILKIIYGYTAETHGRDYLVDMANKAMHEFSEAAVPGRWAVDAFPFLRHIPDWFPGAGFKEIARQMAAQVSKTIDEPYRYVKYQMQEGIHKPSYLSEAIENTGTDARMEHVHKWSAFAMYLAGSDTTVSAFMIFFLAMALFPEVQEKAWEEIERVIGTNRLPVIPDRENLPYVEALVKETLRWETVVPMCVPHASAQNDYIAGYRIPKGAILLPNIYWFMHDPSVYPSPELFRPERFIETPTHKAEPDPRNHNFGYGRRICPGKNMAENSMFMTIAQVLAVFKIEKAIENGKPVEPDRKFGPGVISHPAEFPTSIKPRSEKHAQLIRDALDEFPWQPSDSKGLKAFLQQHD